MTNPVLTALENEVRTDWLFGQVWIHRNDGAYSICHVEDKGKNAETIPLENLRKLAQVDAAGVFRPLCSAPNLKTGWRVELKNAAELLRALDLIYPGAVADWTAARPANPPVTNFREFMGRQTGMYRITNSLDDGTAGEAIKTCCDKTLCLKRRLWSVAGLAPDRLEDKSVIPCLEPCAVTLEFIRKAARAFLDQQLQEKKA